MLALQPEVAYIDEPFNLETGIKGVKRAFQYMPTETNNAELTAHYDSLVNSLLKGKATYKQSLLRDDTTNPMRKTARQLFVSRNNLAYQRQARSPRTTHLLLKDPMACFLTEYLHRNFDARTIIIMRHPTSVIASFKRLNWHYNLHDLTDQTHLWNEHLKPLFKGVDIDKLNEAEAWSYFWLAIYKTLDTFMTRNPNMRLITHEDLSTQPQKELKELYKFCGLPFTQTVSDKIHEYTNADNPTNPTGNKAHVLHRNSSENLHRWKNILTKDETDIIRGITGDFTRKFYPDATWG